MADHPYVGMWVTEDGYIRHELLPNYRYDEARGERESAYQGRYRVTGNYIEYWDDTGFIADGEFIDGVLYHVEWCYTGKNSIRVSDSHMFVQLMEKTNEKSENHAVSCSYASFRFSLRRKRSPGSGADASDFLKRNCPE